MTGEAENKANSASVEVEVGVEVEAELGNKIVKTQRNSTQLNETLKQLRWS